MSKPRQYVLIGAGALVLLAFTAILGTWVYPATMNGKLLRTDADALPGRASLTQFAASEAAPIYARHCAACHGADMKGSRGIGAPDLTDQEWIYGEGRIAEIEETITNGIRSHKPKARNLADMPAFATPVPDARVKMNPLNPQQIEDVVSYLFSIEGREPGDPASVQRGEVVFSDAGGCYDCHGGDAGGDNFIGAVNLRDNIWLYGDGSRRSVFDSIAKGHAGVCPSWSGRISPAKIRALASYIHMRSHRAAGASPRNAS